jgi:hypothetical protein
MIMVKMSIIQIQLERVSLFYKKKMNITHLEMIYHKIEGVLINQIINHKVYHKDK